MASGRKRNVVDAYIHGTAKGPFPPDSKAARMVSEDEIGATHVIKPMPASSASEICFATTYYEAAIPPPATGSECWCFWCGGYVITHPGTVGPDDDSASACVCVCVACNSDRNGCRTGHCSGFFCARPELELFQRPGRELLKFRGIVREKLIASFGTRIERIFMQFHSWRKNVPPPGPRGPTAPVASQTASCPICHILYTPRCGFAGLCGACRVYQRLNPFLIREGVRGSDAPAKARRAVVPTESGAEKAHRK